VLKEMSTKNWFLFLPHGVLYFLSAESTARNQQLKSEKQKENFKKLKNGYAQKYRQTVRRIRGVGPGDETGGYGGKDLHHSFVLLFHLVGNYDFTDINGPTTV